jgi:polygalacturonase
MLVKPTLLICLIMTALFQLSARAHGLEPQPAAPAEPVIPAHTFRLSDFGSIPDGHISNTVAFQKAIAAVKAAGGGTLIVAPGVYLTGPIALCGKINLRLEKGATILFSNRAADYALEKGRRQSLLTAAGCKDIVISGDGVIDGQGKVWWEKVRKALSQLHGQPWTGQNDDRPWMIEFRNCSRIRFENIHVRNSPSFQCAFVNCEDITIRGVNIYAPEPSYNTDGIDPINCSRVLISHCIINTGDDCIAIKASREGSGGGTSDVLISDCSFYEGHGCSLGSGVGPFIRNVLVRRCTFDGTSIGLRYKSSRTRGGLVDNITFTDLKMKDVDRVLDITSFYPPRTLPKPGVHIQPAPLTGKTPIVRHIIIRNLTAENCGEAGRIVGLPEMPLQDMELDDVTINAKTGLRIAYTKGISLDDVTVHASDGKSYMIEGSVSDLRRSPSKGLKGGSISNRP